MTRMRLLAIGLGSAVLLAAGAATASGGDRRPVDDPSSPVPVFVLEKGRYTTFDPPGRQANELVDVNSRGVVAGTFIDLDDTTNRGFLRDKRGRVTRFDYPGASSTFVNKINDRGQIVGRAKFGAGTDPADQRAYLRGRDGRFTTIRVPGAVTTQAIGIDDRGRIVGDYTDADGFFHGYLWEKGRVVATGIDGPEGSGATLTGINDRGQMVGVYQARGTTGLQGFVLDKGVYRTFKDPRLAFTVPLDIDDRGQVVGFTADALPLPQATEAHGFLLRPGANQLTRIDVPGAPATLASGTDARGRITLTDAPDVRQTTPLDINDRGIIVGNVCVDGSCGRRRGFHRDGRGRFITLSVYGSVQTQAYDINNRGQIVGDYLDQDGGVHGYAWSKGRFRTVDIRGAAMTSITGISDHDEMVGLYADPDGVIHGFHRSAHGRVTTIDAPDVLLTVPFDINNGGRIVGITTTAARSARTTTRSAGSCWRRAPAVRSYLAPCGL